MHLQQSVQADEGRLPGELAAPLRPQLRHALDKPLRREILRTLHRDVERPQNIKGIASDLTYFTVNDVDYHVRVLKEAKAVVASDASQTDRHLLLSRVAEDPHVLAALRATQQPDRDCIMRRAGASSPGFLTMFRVPRPAITIRLGERFRRH